MASGGLTMGPTRRPALAGSETWAKVAVGASDALHIAQHLLDAGVVLVRRRRH